MPGDSHNLDRVACARIERMRQRSVRPKPDLSLKRQIATLTGQLETRRRQWGGVGDAWAKTVPAELAYKAEIVGYRGGMLTVRVQDTAARFQLDRFLRTGGEARLIMAAPVGLKRVRLRA